MSKRVVLYLRLSASADDSVSIARQEAELRSYADREGWAVTDTVIDDGISGTKVRANAQRALSMLRRGDADVLLVWALDRFSRQGLGAIAELVDTLDAAPGALFVAMKDGLRSDMAMWRVIAVVLAEVARSEAESVSARRRSELAFRRGLGRHTTGAAPFGYRAIPAPDGIGQTLALHDEEAALVRALADRVLAGDSLTAIVRDLNVDAVPTGRSRARALAHRGEDPAGADRGAWEVTTLKRLLSSDRLLGRMMHDGQPVRGDDGLPVEAFPPILTLGQVEALRVRLRPGGAAPRTRRAARLLSGVAYCALCDRKLYVTGRRGVDVYRCTPFGGSSCPGTSAPAEALERFVASTWLSAAGSAPEVEEVIVDAVETASAALADVEAAIRETTLALAADDANLAALMPRLADLKARRADLRSATTSVSVVTRPTGRTLGEAFASSSDVGWRRSVLVRALDHVTVARAARPGPRFDTGRVAFYWQDDVEV